MANQQGRRKQGTERKADKERERNPNPKVAGEGHGLWRILWNRVEKIFVGAAGIAGMIGAMLYSVAAAHRDLGIWMVWFAVVTVITLGFWGFQKSVWEEDERRRAAALAVNAPTQLPTPPPATMSSGTALIEAPGETALIEVPHQPAPPQDVDAAPEPQAKNADSAKEEVQRKVSAPTPKEIFRRIDREQQASDRKRIQESYKGESVAWDLEFIESEEAYDPKQARISFAEPFHPQRTWTVEIKVEISKERKLLQAKKGTWMHVKGTIDDVRISTIYLTNTDITTIGEPGSRPLMRKDTGSPYPTPEEITRTVRDSPDLMKKLAGEAYVNSHVSWDVKLIGCHGDIGGDDAYIAVTEDLGKKRGESYVIIPIDTSEHRVFLPLKEGALLHVDGVIWGVASNAIIRMERGTNITRRDK